MPSLAACELYSCATPPWDTLSRLSWGPLASISHEYCMNHSHMHVLTWLPPGGAAGGGRSPVGTNVCLLLTLGLAAVCRKTLYQNETMVVTSRGNEKPITQRTPLSAHCSCKSEVFCKIRLGAALVKTEGCKNRMSAQEEPECLHTIVNKV